MAKITPARVRNALFSRFNKVLGRTVGIQIHKHDPKWLPPDFSPEERALFNFVKPFTLGSPERIISLANAVKYVVENGIHGSFVECGVWKGGSVMAIAKTLLALGETRRDLYLFDTFEGMSAPTDIDIGYDGEVATETWKSLNDWVAVTEDVVKTNILTTGYEASKFHLVKGKVEDTLPQKAPNEIALLRLDTDWYESTKHELEHLYPRLARGGILIIDDYGHFEGARKAADEYFKKHDIKLLLNRIDYTARMAIKP